MIMRARVLAIRINLGSALTQDLAYSELSRDHLINRKQLRRIIPVSAMTIWRWGRRDSPVQLPLTSALASCPDLSNLRVMLPVSHFQPLANGRRRPISFESLAIETRHV
jgi:hypothetical protein